MKRFLIAAFVYALAYTPLYAGGHHGQTWTNIGKGEKGDKGDPGLPGVQGDPGSVGAQGLPGANGSSGGQAHDITRIQAGAEVRWYEFDNHVSLNSGYRYDWNHGGHTVDAMIVGFQFGTSAADRKIQLLMEKINLLEGDVADLKMPYRYTVIHEPPTAADQQYNETIKSIIRGTK